MLGICIEASHSRGMGHLFRTLNFIHYLKQYAPKERYIVVVNEDREAEDILKRSEINYIAMDTSADNNWEAKVIKDYGITHILNDRLDTKACSIERMKECGVPVFTIDDMGEGAGLCDINFASLVFDRESDIKGKEVLTGENYLILNPEIGIYKKQKKALKKVLVTMGGSDTYNLTIMVLEALKTVNRQLEVTVVIGPGSKCFYQAKKLVDNNTNGNIAIKIKSRVASLIEEMGRHDLGITAGGVTPFEAAAAGLPTISIAAELHEIGICKRLEELGCSKYLGYWKNIDEKDVKSAIETMSDEDISDMSQSGLDKIKVSGAKNIMEKMGLI